MKKLIICLTLIFIQNNLFAQNFSNSLKGYYSNTKENELYSSIYLNGDGHALINEAYLAEYVQIDNKIYLFPDKSVFIFTLNNDKLIGDSSWVENNTYKKNKDTIRTKEITVPVYKIEPKLLYEFYKINYTEGTDQVSFDYFVDPEKYKNSIEKLCNQGLTTACASYFGLLYLEDLGGLDQLLENKSLNIKTNSKLENLAKFIIDKGDIRGYGLLASYYFSTGNEERGNEILEKGVELNDPKSVNLLLEIELKKIDADIKED